MKKVLLIMALGLMPALTVAGEISLNLDRCAVLNDPTDQAAESRIALHFTIPDSLNIRRIYYAELVISVPIQPLTDDSLFELLVFPLTSEWGEEDIDYAAGEAITDSVLIGTKMVKLGESHEFHIDITPFVHDILAGSRPNHGLIAQADLLGDRNLRIPGNLNGLLRDATRVRIVYR